MKAEITEGTEKVPVQTECLGVSKERRSLILAWDPGVCLEDYGMVYVSS